MRHPEGIDARRDRRERKSPLVIRHGHEGVWGHEDLGPHPGMPHIADHPEEPLYHQRDSHLFPKMGKGDVEEGFVPPGMRMGCVKGTVAVPDLEHGSRRDHLNPRKKAAVPIVEDRHTPLTDLSVSAL